MSDKQFVAYVCDIDCDGTSYAAHLFEGEKGTVEEFPMAESYGSYEILTLEEFYSLPEWNNLDEWSKNYFKKNGYHYFGFSTK